MRLIALLTYAGTLATLCVSTQVASAPADLDVTFGSSGYVFTPIAKTSNLVEMAVHSDGKIIAAGSCVVDRDSEMCVARYNSDGSADTSFSGGGVMFAPAGVVGTLVRRMLVQRDGKIVVFGYCDYGNCVIRYNVNESLDLTFGQGGIARQIGANEKFDIANGALQTNDGSILVVGTCKTSPASTEMCVIRLTEQGQRDVTFGMNGTALSSLGVEYASGIGSAFLDEQNRLTVAGVCGNLVVETARPFCVTRFTSSGQLDPSLNGTGLLRESTPNFLASYVVAARGKLVILGYCTSASTTSADACLRRFNLNGTVDLSLNNGEVRRVVTNTQLVGFAKPAVQTDGKITFGARCTTGAGYFACMGRIGDEGLLDVTFGSNTDYLRTVPTTLYARETSIQSDAKIIVGGSCFAGAFQFCVARYLGGPSSAREAKTMLEYRYAPLDYYFITSRDSDKTALDAVASWRRTGNSFYVLANNESGSSPITRFYFDQVAKNRTRGSHFYTLLPSEVASLQALNPSNLPAPGQPVNEGIDSYAYLPSASGTCATGLLPVYRLFRGNAQFPDDPNHRFTTDLADYNDFVGRGWDGEGVKLCVPQ